MSYEIGIIKNTRGLKGEVVVKKTTDFERFEPDKTIYLLIENQKIELKIKKVYEYKKDLIVSFFNYADINEVEKFKGKVLYTDEKPQLEEDEYHEDYIMNKDVYNQNNIYVGQVIGIMDAPQGYLLRIENNGKNSLVPFNDYFIISVDDKKIVINEIEGLLWKSM